ncbi:MAG: hypothetical protein R3E09_11295 [Novosphingobium sp.]
MVPLMFTGMLSGMVVGMMAAMMPLAAGERRGSWVRRAALSYRFHLDRQRHAARRHAQAEES